MRYMLTIFIFLCLIQARAENNEIHSLTVYPCDKELDFLNAVEKRVNDLVIEEKLEDRVFENLFHNKSMSTFYLPERLEQLKPTEKYLISYITNPERTIFSLVGISRKYLSPENMGVMNIGTGRDIINGQIILHTVPIDISYPLFDLELVALRSHLDKSTYDSLTAVVSRLFLNALDDSVDFSGDIPLFEIQCPYDGRTIDFPDGGFISSSLGHNSPYELNHLTSPGPKGQLMQYPDYEEVYFDFDTITFLDTTMPDQYSKYDNQYVSLNLRFNVNNTNSPLIYRDIQSVKTFVLDYDYLGFTLQRTTDADTWGTLGSVWYRKEDVFKALNNEYFVRFVELMRYGYFYKRF